MNNQNISQRLSNFVRVAFANRRGARRLAISLPMRFTIVCQQKGIVTGKTRSVPARTVNLSRNGLSFEVNSIQVDGIHILLNPDSSIYKTLELELALPEKGVQIKAMPIRFVRNKETGKYIIGVKIMALPPEDRKAFEAFIKEKSNIT
ncbi:MAG: PilZ domain-containing protein [Acidobacteria bacterium]|nr:PilZ domain-containing protein [Acidobacteriota bacterium]